MSAGDRTPSSKRFGISVVAVVSKESDFVILFRFLFGWGIVGVRLGGWFKIFHGLFAGAIASNDFDLLLGTGKPILTDSDQAHSLLIAHNQFLQGQFARLHLIDNCLESLHGLLRIWLCRGGFGLAAHRRLAIKHSAPGVKSTSSDTPMRGRFTVVTLSGHRAARSHAKYMR